MPTIGDVTVVRGGAPTGFSNGFTWTITFESQVEDLELLVVDGNSTAIPIVGPDTQLAVIEARHGMSPSLSLDVIGLKPGVTYITRISARNEAGYGPTTLADATDGGGRGNNNDGLGIVPLGVVAFTALPPPRIAVITPVSASQLEVSLDRGNFDVAANGILGYKVRSFLSSATVDAIYSAEQVPHEVYPRAIVS